MNTNLSTIFRALLIQYAIVAKILKLHYYLLHCTDYLLERMTRLNTVSCIVPNNFNSDQLPEILLYSKDDLDNINNTTILDDTINYLTETKRFNAQLF